MNIESEKWKIYFCENERIPKGGKSNTTYQNNKICVYAYILLLSGRKFKKKKVY